MHNIHGEYMPAGDGTGPDGTYRNCIAPDGTVRPRLRYLNPYTRPRFGWGRGRGRRGRRRW